MSHALPDYELGKKRRQKKNLKGGKQEEKEVERKRRVKH